MSTHNTRKMPFRSFANLIWHGARLC